MKKVIIAITIALAANTAAAAPEEVWQGRGKLLTVDRQPVGDYTLEIKIEELTATESTVRVVVRDPNGGLIKTDTCTMQNLPGDAWHKSCEGGSSRGYMVDNGFGLGIDYYEANDGKAYATTIIFDSETEMRLFRTELVNGAATQFFVEALEKTSQRSK